MISVRRALNQAHLTQVPNSDGNSSSSNDDALKDKTQAIAIQEGIFGVTSSLISDNYFVPFALEVNADPVQASILGVVPSVIAPIGQLLASHQMEKHSRKSALYAGIWGQFLIWPVFILLAIIFSIIGGVAPLTWTIFFFTIIYYTLAGMVTPPWFSIMGDIVPENQRGRYFAKRNLITTAVSLIATLAIGLALDSFKNQNAVIIGFIIIFAVGFTTRLISGLYFRRFYFPPYQFRAEERVTLRQFIQELPKSNFGHFTLFVMFLFFGQWVAGPFFAIYMLEDLQFSYTEYISVVLSVSLFSLFVFPLVGKFSDRFGNIRTIRMGAIIIPLLPLFWLVVKSPLGLILLPQLVSGFAWTAFNLATSNFIYDSFPRGKRAEYIAFYNFTIGLGVVTGGFVGSIIFSILPPDFVINPYLFLFLLSGILRGIAVAIFLPKIKEIRKIQ